MTEKFLDAKDKKKKSAFVSREVQHNDAIVVHFSQKLIKSS